MTSARATHVMGQDIAAAHSHATIHVSLTTLRYVTREEEEEEGEEKEGKRGKRGKGRGEGEKGGARGES